MQNDYGIIKTNPELRKLAREQLKGKWGTAILLCVIYSIGTGLLGAIPYIGIIFSLVLAGPLALGLASCFMKLVRNEPFRFENLFDGFSYFTTALVTQVLMTIYILLWTLLLIIPGIIASLGYSMSFYILNDDPSIGAAEALRRSKEMMNGYKGKLFMLYLSFFGWALLCAITLGIGSLWLIPYINASTANFYQNLKDSQTGSSNNSSDNKNEPIIEV